MEKGETTGNAVRCNAFLRTAERYRQFSEHFCQEYVTDNFFGFFVVNFEQIFSCLCLPMVSYQRSMKRT